MAKKVERVAVFVDGGNLYFKLRHVFGKDLRGLEFAYKSLCEKLAGDRHIVYMGYYIGAVKAKPDDKIGQKLRQNQQKLFGNLRAGGFEVKLGHLMENDGVFHEKGVDVQLALDIVNMAYEKEYDTAIIISSDTDLVPAIKKARELKRSVEYIGFSIKPSFGMPAVFAGAYAGAISLLPIEQFAQAAGMLTNWQALVAVFVLGVLFGLFPDVDTNSKAQDMFFGIVFPLDILLIWQGYIHTAAFLGLIAMLPIVGHHRGWTHKKWAMFLVPLPILLIPYMNNDALLASSVYYGAAVVGYFSHLLLDGLIWRHFRIKN